MPSSALLGLSTLSLHDALPIWRGMILQLNPTPPMPVALLVAAAATPATMVPCPLTSLVSLLLLTKFHPETIWPARSECQPETPERSEEHTSELQSPCNLVCRLLPSSGSPLFPYTTLFRSGGA